MLHCNNQTPQNHPFVIGVPSAFRANYSRRIDIMKAARTSFTIVSGTVVGET